MPAAQQRDWGDDAVGSPVGRSNREPVAGTCPRASMHTQIAAATLAKNAGVRQL
jgi:hypothetical protein